MRSADDALRGYSVRAADDADLDAVVSLIDSADLALGLERDPVRDFLKWIWHVPSTVLERDTRIVLRGDVVACFAQALWNREEGGPLQVMARVHPGHRRVGLGTWSVWWAEGVAAERGSEGTRARIAHRDEEAAALLGARGYVRVRSSWTMQRELGAREDPGPSPAGVTFRPFETGRDEHALHEAIESSFAEHWGFHPVPYETFAEEMYGAHDWDPNLAFLAEVDGNVVANAVSLSSQDGGYVAVLGVVPDARGRGIAKGLLRRSFAALAERGHRIVRLGVDAQNPTGAVALYESVGMHVSHAYDVYDLGTPEADLARKT